ncbi:transporter substrate-binding domain-containing protein [Legionella jordanis]|uniref:Putative amino acid ABC transporter, periplasmic binding protein n=1 Tax=Legionella jordanis TaxID=456 RepID=A0A0W0V8T3_9GAMM|nr:transporter substrate-binding domain-containing protein [Legionella jordanis]KTD16555.1 putative amino acid ABC transporter, periplasmic binding protein [Legionella jordanis]RMX03905.1 ABC transporter substrate-binding protein [Legionella jordanis]RMX22029.1 ABC transporter substrate-binding protein [Legionella jordanis]VEH11982.1 putative amino acid ABC transporter, periplasmic binding protein [Legionella jordanis]HAT8712713.1 transporter substrate-binding domain-containing protein [Legion
MKKLIFVLTLFVSSVSLGAQGQDANVQAQQPLRVAVDSFTPPFVMEGANHQLFGFDISMMDYLCRHLQRRCIFVPMPFEQILQSVEMGKVDAAVSALTITSARATRVNFSLPYLLSNSRFLTTSDKAKQPFGLESLNNRTFGVEEGTIFPTVINLLGVRNPTINEYQDAPTLIDALQSDKIDYALMDDPSAMYWQAASTGILAVVGQPFSYGFGFGIAINPKATDLLQDINKALVDYQNSKEFKRDYGKYIAHF